MLHSRKDRQARIPSLKILERPMKNVIDTTALSLSPTFAEQPKSFNQPKIFDFANPLSYQSGRNNESKLEINFSVSPGPIKGASGDFGEIFTGSTNSKMRKNLSSKILPKLISKAFDPVNYVRGSNKNLAANLREMKSLNERVIVPHEVSMTNNDTQKVDRNQSYNTKSGNNTFRIEDESSFLLVEDQKKLISIENRDLRALVLTYKNSAADKSPTNGAATPMAEKSKLYDSDEDPGSLSPKPRDKSPIRQIGDGPAKSVDAGLHYRLANLFKTFAKYKSMYYTLDTAVTEACKVFNCGYTRILLTHELAKKIYNESGSDKIKPERLTLGDTGVQIIERKEDNIGEYGCLEKMANVLELRKPFNSEGMGLSCPIVSMNNESQELWGAIQIVGPMTTTKHDKSKRNKGFAAKDELLLESYAKIITLLIDCHQRDWIINEQDKKLIQYNDSTLVAHLVSTRNHQDLLEIIKEKLENYFGFENIGLLYYESKADVMYTYDVKRKQDGRYYITDPLRFSARSGISGYSISHNADLLVFGEPRKNKYFQPEVDNIAGAPAVRNLMIALLKDEKGQKTGVLQLVNKRNGGTINEKDEMLVRAIQRLLGSLISHINDITKTISISIAMKKTMKNIEDTFDTPAPQK